MTIVWRFENLWPSEWRQLLGFLLFQCVTGVSVFGLISTSAIQDGGVSESSSLKPRREFAFEHFPNLSPVPLMSNTFHSGHYLSVASCPYVCILCAHTNVRWLGKHIVGYLRHSTIYYYSLIFFDSVGKSYKENSFKTKYDIPLNGRFFYFIIKYHYVVAIIWIYFFKNHVYNFR